MFDFVSDGYVNHRVVKYDKNGRFVRQVGSERSGSEPSQFSTPHGVAVDLQDVFNRPADVAWDAAGNIYVADGLGNNNRVAKFDKNGKFVRSWGNTGLGQGQFRQVHGIAIDAQGMVYVADAGNRRIQVFDGDGNFKTMFLNVGTPAALCITPGPRQFLYTSNSNPPDDIDR